MKDISIYATQIMDLGVLYLPRLFLAILVLAIGWWISNLITKFACRAFEKSSVNSVELESFMSSMINIGLKILLVISVAGMVGIETTSFVGIIAAMGFAVGLALQGNLSNFAAGVLILMMRPFKVGDEVKLKGYWCFVHEIQIFHTIMLNFDNTMIIIPNSVIMGDVIQNLSTREKRKISVKLNVPYTEDLLKVEKLIVDAAFSVEGVDQSAKPFIWVQGFDSHFVVLSISFTTTQDIFWDVEVKVNKAVLAALNENKIQIAYPEGVEFGKFGVQAQKFV